MSLKFTLKQLLPSKYGVCLIDTFAISWVKGNKENRIIFIQPVINF